MITYESHRRATVEKLIKDTQTVTGQIDMTRLAPLMCRVLNVDIPDDLIGADTEYKDTDDVLRLLYSALGPEHPDRNGQLLMSDDQFICRYKPERDDNGDLYVQHSVDSEEIDKAAMQRKCWTAVDADGGSIAFRFGRHWQDGIYSIITENPLEYAQAKCFVLVNNLVCVSKAVLDGKEETFVSPAELVFPYQDDVSSELDIPDDNRDVQSIIEDRLVNYTDLDHEEFTWRLTKMEDPTLYPTTWTVA